MSPAKDIGSAAEQDPAAAHSTIMKRFVQLTTLNNLNQFVLTVALIPTW